ncbi:MAG: stage II sporulation protein D [Oscillospiraceae bacterium]
MKPIILISLLLVLFAVLFPFVTALNFPLPVPDAEPEASPESVETSSIVPQSPIDDSVSVRLLTGGEIKTLPMSDYLIGVVGAEMPASFETEALKAQAVAARTYTLYKMLVSPSSNHPDADVCDDPACCKAYADDAELLEKWGARYGQYRDKIASAVAETDGQCLLYEDEPILAVFHSSSCGSTEASENVWSDALPYLRQVTSPETAADVPEYFSTVLVAFSDFKETVLEVYPNAVFGDDKSTWITDTSFTESGRLDSACIGGVTVSGTEIRTLFALRSAAVEISVTEDSVVFRTTGYGHGVGMSQYGSNVLAEQGYDYKEILLHYYTGATIGTAAK